MTQYFLPEQKEEQSDDDPENNNHGKLEHGGVRACPRLIPRIWIKKTSRSFTDGYLQIDNSMYTVCL